MNDNTTPDPAVESRKRIDGMRRATFTPNQLTAPETATLIQGIVGDVSMLGLRVVNNHDANEPLPAGFNLALIPIPRNKGAGESREVVGLVIGIVPSLTATAETDGGNRFIEDAITDRHMNKLANAARKVLVDGKATSIPATVLDFITNQRAAESVEGFNKVHTKVMATIGKTLKGLNKTKFRDCLAIAAYADQQYPAVAQAKWVGVIDAMMAECTRQGIDPGVMATWKETRDAAAANTGDFDLDGLADAFADEAEREAEAEGSSPE